MEKETNRDFRNGYTPKVQYHRNLERSVPVLCLKAKRKRSLSIFFI